MSFGFLPQSLTISCNNVMFASKYHWHVYVCYLFCMHCCTLSPLPPSLLPCDFSWLLHRSATWLSNQISAAGGRLHVWSGKAKICDVPGQVFWVAPAALRGVYFCKCVNLSVQHHAMFYAALMSFFLISNIRVIRALLRKMLRGKLFWSAFIGVPSNSTPFESPKRLPSAVALHLAFIDWFDSHQSGEAAEAAHHSGRSRPLWREVVTSADFWYILFLGSHW